MNNSDTNQDEDVIKIQKDAFEKGDPDVYKFVDNLIKIKSNEDSPDNRSDSECEVMELSDSINEYKCDTKSDSEDSLEADIIPKQDSVSLLTSDGTSLSASGELNDLNLKSECFEAEYPLNNTAPDVCSETLVEETLHDSKSYVERVISSNDSHSETLNGIIHKHSNIKHVNKALDKVVGGEKLLKILSALQGNDVSSLKMAAVSPGGLLSDDIRRKVWPKLVGVDLVETSPRPCQEEIENHPYFNQVVLDVNRSLKRFPPSIREAQRLTMLDQLVSLIMRVLCKHPELHYYQGYHDICVTFLLVLGEETAFHVVEKLSLTHLRVFMEKSMDPTIHLLENMYLLIGKKHLKYQDFLLKSEVGVAYCLSWLITWFSHVLNDYDTVVRLFDFFIVSHPWMPMYVTTSLVLYRDLEVIKQDCDMASVHSYLSKIPDDLPFELLLSEALDLFECYKPDQINKKRPYIERDKRKRVRRLNYIPRNKLVQTTLVIAVAVLTAYIYQVFNY